MKPSPWLLALLATALMTGCKEQLESLFGGKKPSSPPSAPATPPEPRPATPPTGSAARPESPKPVAKPAAPPTAASPDPAPAPKSEMERKIEEKYPLPDFKPLEELVAGWNNVPPNVIGAIGTITVNAPVEYQLYVDGNPIGSSKAPAGHKAKPLQHKPGQLLVTNSPDGTTRGVVNVDDTTFKQQIQALYDGKVAEATERVLSARRVSLQALSQGGETRSFTDVTGDPRFQPVREYLAAGNLECGILEEAKEWLWLGRENHKGQNYDVVLVNFEVNTLFGIFPNSMKCLLQNGKVIQWIDAETGEDRR